MSILEECTLRSWQVGLRDLRVIDVFGVRMKLSELLKFNIGIFPIPSAQNHPSKGSVNQVLP